ncbi:MAG TPA: alternative ribosome rescue aminoacyl-tRNA hydrolase ArfB [Pirellulaceae bacterium]|nr:alternative ribosome rescue aminoacyl-tRNA hydrolase ArfB [Pirellulaceae bacterium]
MLYIDDSLSIPISEFEFSFARSPGPGGQNVNKVNSKAILKWQVVRSTSLPDDIRRRFIKMAGRRISKDGELTISSHRFRDQSRNVADCLAKLRALLFEAARPPKVRRATRPTRGAHLRRLDSKRRQSHKKSDRGPWRNESS